MEPKYMSWKKFHLRLLFCYRIEQIKPILSFFLFWKLNRRAQCKYEQTATDASKILFIF